MGKEGVTPRLVYQYWRVQNCGNKTRLNQIATSMVIQQRRVILWSAIKYTLLVKVFMRSFFFSRKEWSTWRRFCELRIFHHEEPMWSQGGVATSSFFREWECTEEGVIIHNELYANVETSFVWWMEPLPCCMVNGKLLQAK